MANEKLSLLSFPQKLEGGKLHFNILIIPRNINPLLPMDSLDPTPDVLPVFADTAAAFKCMIINNLDDGLPVSANVNLEIKANLINPISSSRNVWEALRLQLQTTDGLQIDDDAPKIKDNTARGSLDKFKNKQIKKYLPFSYRDSFNFTKSRTKYAITDDEYHCAIKNNKKANDTKTNRDKISWGKAIALCLRNPLLAEKAGLVYHGTIDLPANVYDEGGWLYMDFDPSCAFSTLDAVLIKKYAARIPSLKNLNKRTLFAAVQFPIDAINNGGYDDVMMEAIQYDDGFAKIVHANQPVNHYLLEEKDNSNPPMKDTGIRIGWDDEQITIWQNRQMTQKDEKKGVEVNAPLGVFSYCLDSRMKGDTVWLSQNSILAPNGLTVQEGNISVADPGAVLELGSEIHAAAHGNAEVDGFWLPMYFVNWIGNSLAIPDKDAEEINQLTSSNTKEVKNKYTDPANYKDETDPNKVTEKIENYKANNSINTIPKQTFHPFTQNPSEKLALLYGKDYQFRVRLMDLTGGTPDTGKEPLHGGENQIEELHFRRHTGAGPLRIKTIQDRLNALDKDDPIPDLSRLEEVILNGPQELTIERPMLSYPAVVFTGKYKNPDAITRLKSILQNLPLAAQQSEVNIGLPDPDVNFFKVLVEMKSLEMDNEKSENGKESYVKLYDKPFNFSSDFNASFNLKIAYGDLNQLSFDEELENTGPKDTLLLPTARNLRLTFRAMVDDADNKYADKSIELGKPVSLSSFKDSDNEKELLEKNNERLRAIYLQPESPGHTAVTDPSKKQEQTSGTPVEMERLARELDLVAKNLTIEGQNGRRTQFGCSKLMRHSLSPDSSSVTFSSLSELFNHWIIAVQYKMIRDWSWDGVAVESFSVFRKMRYEADANYSTEIHVGTINVSRTANITDLTNPLRDHVNLVFLDALDPKQGNDSFPDEIFISYRVVAHFKAGSGNQHDAIEPMEIKVPVTIIPHQVPKLISAGIALSPYESHNNYSFTTTRQKFLWLEMEEGPKDPNDAFFVRVLANAPDPMLCLVDEDIKLNNPVDPPLNIDDEKIRVIMPGMKNDSAGMGAMQEIKPEQMADSRFFLLALPPGLHEASDELFGFFSYEIRVGHKKDLWSTAQARYGRPLKVNGVQHPAPALICTASRQKYFPNPASKKQSQQIIISAPFANAVLNGKNVAPIPPQTTLWCFLYTQTKQADGKEYRNVLLTSKYMPYSFSQNQEDEGTRYGSCSFKQEEISGLLGRLGLPVTCSLSVLCVEMFPLDNAWRIAEPRDPHHTYGDDYLFGNFYNNYKAGSGYSKTMVPSVSEQFNPLIEDLGKYRIYRTSALVAVDNICCEDC